MGLTKEPMALFFQDRVSVFTLFFCDGDEFFQSRIVVPFFIEESVGKGSGSGQRNVAKSPVRKPGLRKNAIAVACPDKSQGRLKIVAEIDGFRRHVPGDAVLILGGFRGKGIGIAEDKPFRKEILFRNLVLFGKGMGPWENTAQRRVKQLIVHHRSSQRNIILKSDQEIDLPVVKQV